MSHPISRRTKTGNYLILVQGEGLGTGIATGNLRLVQNDTVEAELLIRRANELSRLETVPTTQNEPFFGPEWNELFKRIRMIMWTKVG